MIEGDETELYHSIICPIYALEPIDINHDTKALYFSILEEIDKFTKSKNHSQRGNFFLREFEEWIKENISNGIKVVNGTEENIRFIDL